jgi:hypothetical protein
MTMQNHHTGGCAMLVDEVVARLEAGKLRSAVEQAHKFAFTAEIIEAVVSMASKITVEEMARFARLPFQTCWFELPGDGGPYKKTGYMLMELGQQELPTTIPEFINRLVIVQAFGLRHDGDIEGVRFALSFSESRLAVTEEAYENDAKWIVGLMLVLNTKNLIEKTEIDVSRLNRRRARRGRPPLFSYHVCKVHRDLKSGSRSACTSNFEAGVRAHLVRGHLKARKTGLYWWRPFKRGSPKLGFAHKDYQVSA